MVKSPKSQYNAADLIDTFGTPNPSSTAVQKWKASWRETGGMVKVTNYTAAARFLEEAGIDRLFYQFWSKHEDAEATVGLYVIFFKEEHEVFFKLHAGIT